MAVTPGQSLLDPASGSATAGAARWIEGVLLDQMAVSLCMIAVAVVGFVMLSGRLPVRRGMWTMLGCFVLLGAPVIAGVFSDGGRSDVPVQVAAPVVERPELEAREELQPARNDPFSGAQLWHWWSNTTARDMVKAAGNPKRLMAQVRQNGRMTTILADLSQRAIEQLTLLVLQERTQLTLDHVVNNVRESMKVFV